MKTSVKWTGSSSMVGINDKGQEVKMDWEEGPNPVQLLLQTVGACSLADIVTGLKDRKFSDVWIDMEGERRSEHPRVFTEIMMTYHIKGDVPRKLLERLIEKSHTTYCTVSNMLVEVKKDWKLVIHKD